MKGWTMRLRTIAYVVCTSALLMSCTQLGIAPGDPHDTSDQVTIAQGIWGNVWFWEGDFMPTWPPHAGSVTAVERDVWVFEATRFDSAIGSPGGFYQQVLTRLVGRTRSNARGFFQIALPAGKYSIFVSEGNQLYANGSDGAGHLCPGTVEPGGVTRVQVDINYKATY
jgi:hypothetical protein